MNYNSSCEQVHACNIGTRDAASLIESSITLRFRLYPGSSGKKLCMPYISLEVKLSYDPSWSSVGLLVHRLFGLSVGRSVFHNFKFYFPCSYRSNCLSVYLSSKNKAIMIQLFKVKSYVYISHIYG